MKKKVISVISLILVFSLIFLFVSDLCKRKYSDNKYRIFYEESANMDVLFFGSSIVHYSIYPMQLWHDYGITSYNMGNDSERLQMTYYDILNALDHASPKVIVVDVCALSWAGGNRDNTLKDHFFLDSVPLSVNKIKTVNAIFDGRERFEYLFPFELYHSRWNELTEEDFFFHTRDVKYGAIINTGILPTEYPAPELYEQSREVDVAVEHDTINRIIDLCRSKGVTPVFVYAPSGHRGGDQKIREQADEYFATLDVDYHQLLYLDCIEWDRDFLDGAHLNYNGGVKYTDFLGQLLKSTYNLPDHRNDASIADKWNKDYEAYEADILELTSEASPDEP